VFRELGLGQVDILTNFPLLPLWFYFTTNNIRTDSSKLEVENEVSLPLLLAQKVKK